MILNENRYSFRHNVPDKMCQNFQTHHQEMVKMQIQGERFLPWSGILPQAHTLDLNNFLAA